VRRDTETVSAGLHSRKKSKRALRSAGVHRATLIPRIKWANSPDRQAFRSWRTCTLVRVCLPEVVH